MADFRQTTGTWTAPYETNLKKLAQSTPALSALSLGIIPAARMNLGALGNAASFMMSPNVDKRTPSEKGTEMADYIQDRVGSGIGSSQGATRLGVPTPAGVAPFWSFNTGDGYLNKSEPVSASLQTRRPVAPPLVKTVTPPVVTIATPKGAPKSSSGGKSITPEAPALPKFVGSGSYSDGSPIQDTLSASDKMVMPGNNTGVFQQSGATPTIGPANQIGLYYTPEEQKQVEQMKLDAANSRQPAALPDMSPGSQGAWEREQTQNNAMDSILNRMPEVSRGLPKNVIGALERVQAGEHQGNEYDIAKGNLALGQVTGLGNLGVAQGKLGLEAAKTPAEINLLQEHANALINQGKFQEAKILLGQLGIMSKASNATKNMTEAYQDPATMRNNVEYVKFLQNTAALEPDPAKKKQLMAEMDNYQKLIHEHSKLPPRPVNAGGSSSALDLSTLYGLE